MSQRELMSNGNKGVFHTAQIFIAGKKPDLSIYLFDSKVVFPRIVNKSMKIILQNKNEKLLTCLGNISKQKILWLSILRKYFNKPRWLKWIYNIDFF